MDLVYLVVIVFIVSIVSIFTAMVVLEGQAAIEDTGMQENATQEVTESYIGGLVALDSAILFFFVVSCLMAVSLAFMIPTQPIFMVFSVLFLAVAIVLTVLFGNVYAAVASMDQLASAQTHFPLTWYIWSYMVEIVAATGFAVVIAAYISSRRGGI